MRCPYCGDIHPENARFCPRTGQTIAPVRPTGKKISPGVLILGIAGLLVIAAGTAWIVRDALPAASEQVGAVEAERTGPLPGSGDGKTPAGQPPAAPYDTLPPPEPTPIPPGTATPAPAPTSTQVPSQTPAPTETPLPTPTRIVIQAVTQTNPKDQAEMVYVAAGAFLMGSDPGSDPYFWGAEAPSHTVALDGFWIYTHEVTNAMYQACVAQKACPIPEKNASRTRDSYYDNPEYADYPVVFVNWTSAQSYCVWAGSQLPTEAQWEKAARGTDGRLFPWAGAYTNAHANLCDTNCTNSQRDREYDDGYRDTSPVGSFPEGAGPYGALDMAGNAWEWVHDWFQEGYYQVSPMENPPGPASSKYRGVRGGSFDNPLGGVRAVVRYAVRPDLALDTVGFRCAVQEK